MKKKRLFRKRLIRLFFFILIAAAGCAVFFFYEKEKEQEKRFNELEESLEDEQEQEDEPAPCSPDSREKDRRNKDYLGWLKIEGSSISYPVMQRKGDSEYYLHRDFDGNYSFYGTPFLDYRCTIDSDNCILYGHNINGGRMFGALHAFADKNYCLSHPDIVFCVGEQKRIYQIISVIQTTTASDLYSFTDVGNWEEYQDYVKRILKGSLYQTGMAETIKKEMDEESKEKFFKKYQFLMLSTCRSWVGRDARLLVVAARVRAKL